MPTLPNPDVIILIEKMLDDAVRTRHPRVLEYLKKNDILAHALGLEDHYLNYSEVLEYLLMYLDLGIVAKRCVTVQSNDVSAETLRMNFVALITSHGFHKRWERNHHRNFIEALFDSLEKSSVKYAFVSMLFQNKKSVKKDFLPEIFYDANGSPRCHRHSTFMIRAVYQKTKNFQKTLELFWEGYDFRHTPAVEEYYAIAETLFFKDKIAFLEFVATGSHAEIYPQRVDVLMEYLYALTKGSNTYHEQFVAVLNRINMKMDEIVFNLEQYPFVFVNKRQGTLALELA